MGKIILWCKECFEQKPCTVYEWLQIELPTDFSARLEAPCRKHVGAK